MCVIALYCAYRARCSQQRMLAVGLITTKRQLGKVIYHVEGGLVYSRWGVVYLLATKILGAGLLLHYGITIWLLLPLAVLESGGGFVRFALTPTRRMLRHAFYCRHNRVALLHLMGVKELE